MTWDNRSGPGGAGNTTRSLTRSLDETKEGLSWSLPKDALNAPTVRSAANLSQTKTATAGLTAKASGPTAKHAVRFGVALYMMSRSKFAGSWSPAKYATSASNQNGIPATASCGSSTRTTTTRQVNGADCSARAATTASACSATTSSCSSVPSSICRTLPVSRCSTMGQSKNVRSGASPCCREPHEITAGMAFPKTYIMTGNKREQVKQAGNAVTPPAARDLVAIGAESLS